MEDEDALTDDNTSRNPRKEIPLPRGAEPAADRRGNVFGTRKLTDSAAVYDHNAWDDPEWTKEDEKNAIDVIKYQADNPVPPEKIPYYNRNPEKFWDEFYKRHVDKFFKDRRWILIECPELFYDPIECPVIKPLRILELGCGVGNTIIPILSYIGAASEGLYIHGLDYSKEAVKIAKQHEKYNPKVWDASVFDITRECDEILSIIPPGSIDVCFAVFVFSAVEPSSWDAVSKNIHKLLKPGGVVIFRDYGLYDMVQLRFRSERLIGENLYVRGDGTKVHFFSKEQLLDIFTADKFEVLNNDYDSRLLLNRSRMLKMHRIWIRAKFRKIPDGVVNLNL